MRYFILETQHTESDVNFVKTEKYTLASALSYYHKRISDYYVDTTYLSANVSLLDENLQNVEPAVEVITSYATPTNE